MPAKSVLGEPLIRVWAIHTVSFVRRAHFLPWWMAPRNAKIVQKATGQPRGLKPRTHAALALQEQATARRVSPETIRAGRRKACASHAPEAMSQTASIKQAVKNAKPTFIKIARVCNTASHAPPANMLTKRVPPPAFRAQAPVGSWWMAYAGWAAA
jgi:hypothetical protein